MPAGRYVKTYDMPAGKTKVFKERQFYYFLKNDVRN